MRRFMLLLATVAMVVMMSGAPALAIESEDKEEEKCAEAQADLLEATLAILLGVGEEKERIKALEKAEENCSPN